jgi:hypothetical protein
MIRRDFLHRHCASRTSLLPRQVFPLQSGRCTGKEFPNENIFACRAGPGVVPERWTVQSPPKMSPRRKAAFPRHDIEPSPCSPGIASTLPLHRVSERVTGRSIVPTGCYCKNCQAARRKLRALPCEAAWAAPPGPQENTAPAPMRFRIQGSQPARAKPICP